ncbi:PEP-CTERM sorting domain-containing protein [Alteromonas halophila]|uniref:Ice-binding protein C-terminal domain-containing protein n=1 Tax=Alteromonas halophila TaxID=516698 RepID=A0A918JK06_9ALTE|nr:PEP-CTERM sorting domain-containing protein [Alteromonas halophila]GGW84079.1 hypothetical protein GCM10007391_17210 [Alteromonas halophila]
MHIKSSVKSFMVLLFLSVSLGANASLITNGTFDSDLSGWTINGSANGNIDTVWNAGTAHLGRPGQEGFSEFYQLFTVDANAMSADIWFDYQWQVTAPSTPDEFDVYFQYLDANTSQFVVVNLFSMLSSNATFGQTAQFNGMLDLTGYNLAGTTNNAGLFFKLTETPNTPASPGTRIQLDNVQFETSAAGNSFAVPAPGTLLLLSLSLLGIGWSSRKK